MDKLNKTRRLPGRRLGQNTHVGDKCANLPNAGARIRQMRQFAVFICVCATGLSTRVQALDLRRAIVTTSIPLKGPEQKAVAMLVEEVEKRTGIRWPVYGTPAERTSAEK